MKDYFLRDGGKLKKIGFNKESWIFTLLITNENNLKFKNENIN